MAYEVGANLSVRNILQLTPLTLAAKLARMDIFFHILKLEREIYWQIGEYVIPTTVTDLVVFFTFKLQVVLLVQLTHYHKLTP